MGCTPYGILAALALLALLAATYLAGRRKGVDYGSFIRFAVLAAPLAFLCSRVVYCLCHLSYYLDMGHPELMLHVQDGGYTMIGALLGVVLAAVAAEKWRRLPAGTMLDAAAVGMPVALVIARLAEPLSSMGLTEIGWGHAYTSPVFAFLDELCEGVHPVFAYEAIAAAVIFVLLLVIRRTARRGDVMLSFLLLFGGSQTVLESMLDTTHMMFLFMHITQLVALLLALLPLILWSIRYPRPDRSAKVRLAAAWALIAACIISALVQEINVTGDDRTAAIAPFVPVVLTAGAAFWCIAWRKAGLLRLLPAAIASLLAIFALVINQTELVGLHFRLVLWGVMALDMFLLCWAGFALLTPAPANIEE